MYYTYAHYTNDTNTLFYIGKGKWHTDDNTQRYKQHWNRNIWWKRKVNKHGFKAEILCRFKTEQEALDHERFLIATFKDLNYTLVNLTDGGEGTSGRYCSDETKTKISNAHKGRKRNLTDEQRKELSIRAKQLAESNRGKKLSKEHKEKISKNHKPPKIILASKNNEQIVLCGLKDMKEKGFDPSRTYRALREQNKYKGYTFKEQEHL